MILCDFFGCPLAEGFRSRVGAAARLPRCPQVRREFGSSAQHQDSPYYKQASSTHFPQQQAPLGDA